MAWMPRLAAAPIALIAWFALAVQVRATLGMTGSPAETLWIMLRYFTITTNLLVAIVMSIVALGARVSPFVLGGTTLAIILVGVIYMTLLRGLLELSCGALLADMLLHKVTPVLLPLWWLAFATKGRLGWRDPLLWAIYPLVYLIYALARGTAEGKYAYPFLDLGAHGIAAVAINSILIAAAFLIAGEAFVWIDGLLSRTAKGQSAE